MTRWQRWTSYLVLAVCLLSGTVYFLLQDYWEWSPPEMRFWWISHGASSFVAMLVIGAATSQHVIVSWRARRGRVTGSANLAFMLLLILSALVLFYGVEAWHVPAHWAHVIAGLIALVLFPAHIFWGRTRKAHLGTFTVGK